MQRKFKFLAANFAELLRYRKNDYLGYWAVGQLYSHAIKSKSERVSIDLSAGTIIPHNPYFDDLIEIYRSQINDEISKAGIEVTEISRIKIDYRFEIDVEKERKRVKGYRFGHKLLPYLASVSVVSLNNLVYKHTARGFCVPHNPLKEQRRPGYS